MVCQNYQPPPGFDVAASRILNVSSNKPAHSSDARSGAQEEEEEGAETLCPAVVPFLACGRLEWDSDMTYDLEAAKDGGKGAAERLLPVQPPLAPHYREALEKANRWRF